MEGLEVKILLGEKLKHRGELAHHHILKFCHELGMGGVSVFRTVESIDRKGKVHEESFFESAGAHSLMIMVICRKEKGMTLMEYLQEEQLPCTIASYPVNYREISKIDPET